MACMYSTKTPKSFSLPTFRNCNREIYPSDCANFLCIMICSETPSQNKYPIHTQRGKQSINPSFHPSSMRQKQRKQRKNHC